VCIINISWNELSLVLTSNVKGKALLWTEFSELFVFASFGKVRLSKFGNFSEKNGIFELAKFSRKSSEKSCEIKVRKKVWKLFKNVRKFRKFWKKYVKFEFLGQKIRKKFGKVWKKFGKVWKFQKLLFSDLSEIYEKMTLNSKFGNREKLVPTRKPTRKFGMQGLSERSTLIYNSIIWMATF